MVTSTCFYLFLCSLSYLISQFYITFKAMYHGSRVRYSWFSKLHQLTTTPTYFWAKRISITAFFVNGGLTYWIIVNSEGPMVVGGGGRVEKEILGHLMGECW